MRRNIVIGPHKETPPPTTAYRNWRMIPANENSRVTYIATTDAFKNALKQSPLVKLSQDLQVCKRKLQRFIVCRVLVAADPCIPTQCLEMLDGSRTRGPCIMIMRNDQPIPRFCCKARSSCMKCDSENLV